MYTHTKTDINGQALDRYSPAANPIYIVNMLCIDLNRDTLWISVWATHIYIAYAIQRKKERKKEKQLENYR